MAATASDRVDWHIPYIMKRPSEIDPNRELDTRGGVGKDRQGRAEKRRLEQERVVSSFRCNP